MGLSWRRGIDKVICSRKAVITGPWKWGHLVTVSDIRGKINFFQGHFIGRGWSAFSQRVIVKQHDCEISNEENQRQTCSPH